MAIKEVSLIILGVKNMKKYVVWTINLVLSFTLCLVGNAFGMDSTSLYELRRTGKEKLVGTGNLTEEAQQIHRELLGKVKKLDGYDDIYVGAGYSAAGEPMFFAMEKLDDDRAKVWQSYADALYVDPSVIYKLNQLRFLCQNQEKRAELKQAGDFYRLGLMDTMCPNKQKLGMMFAESGIRAGLNGFNEMLGMQTSGAAIYVAYASTQPITGPFRPKKEIKKNPSIDEFEAAYPDIIISIAVDMQLETSRTQHRGIFKNPFFEIYGLYKNIAMILHGWAGLVEKDIFNKVYMTVYPTPPAAESLHRSIKPGNMYLGIDTAPEFKYGNDEELGKKFPPIKRELIGDAPSKSYAGEPAHIFELDVLSKYYTESSEKK